MKKNILFALLLLILLFTYPTKIKHKKNNSIDKENTVRIRHYNDKKYDSEEEKVVKISKEFYKQNNTPNPFDTSKNKNVIPHSLRHSKGKIMLSHEQYIITETKQD